MRGWGDSRPLAFYYSIRSSSSERNDSKMGKQIKNGDTKTDCIYETHKIFYEKHKIGIIFVF